jgi:hypothetical protein
VTKRVIVDRGSLLPHPPFPRNDRWLTVLRGGGLLVPLEEIPYVVRSLSCSWVGAVADADIRPTLIFLARALPNDVLVISIGLPNNPVQCARNR